MDLLADTTFLIDLWREQRKAGPATAFARQHADDIIGISWVVAGEFLSGALATGHAPNLIDGFLARYPLVHSSPDIIREYAGLYADLKRRNSLIGPSDMWIAAAARSHRVPLLTRNGGEFARIPDLQVLAYRQA